MRITLEDGTEFEIRSMRREDQRLVMAMESEGKDRDFAAYGKAQDKIMGRVYGKDKRLALARDFARVWQATLVYSIGGGEGDLGNSSRSGPGGTTRTG